MILDAILDALLDTAKTVPFLLAAFLLLETLEHYSNNFMNRALGKMGKAGRADVKYGIDGAGPPGEFSSGTWLGAVYRCCY